MSHWFRPPPPRQPVPVEGDAPAAAPRAGQTIDLLSWNVQFCGSRRHHFFYDGGSDVHVPEAEVRATQASMAALLGRVRPALLLLQEVDRDSRRTQRIDQLPALVAAAGARRWASTWYHRAPFVPHPLPTMLGRVDMHLALACRTALVGAERLQLPLLRESRVRQAFNLKRALLWASVPVEGWRRPLHLAVAHLSAFSRGDGTMERQIAALAAWMGEREDAGQPWVLAGDLNLLPPGDDPGRLPDGRETYADWPNPIERLTTRFRTAVPSARWLDPEQRTYLPYGATSPDRKIDWIFLGPRVEAVSAGPLPDLEGLSDHLPLHARIALAPERTP
ncbi:MAG: endonuclease/exonuclease/phosphatase family protein [Pseudomonadota bacterium]